MPTSVIDSASDVQSDWDDERSMGSSSIMSSNSSGGSRSRSVISSVPSVASSDVGSQDEDRNKKYGSLVFNNLSRVVH
jgi:hypothetical protein